MLYSKDGKIATREGKVLERRVNTLTFEVTGDRFPKLTNTGQFAFVIIFNRASSFTVNYGDGVVETFSNVNGYSVSFNNPENAHTYIDGNTGPRLVTFTFEDIKVIEIISIRFCEVIGSFPIEVGFLEDLEAISLRAVKFDLFPKTFFALNNLRELSFNSPFSFKFPQIFDGVFNNRLEILNLTNSFDLSAEDHISSNFFKINQLKNTLVSLSCERCDLRSLPSEITELYKLEIFRSLFNNYIKLPEEVTQLPKLRTLVVGNSPPRLVDDTTMLDFSNQNLVENLTLRISNLDFLEISVKWEGLKSLQIITLFGDMVITDARFDEFIDQFYLLTVNNAYLNPATAPIEEDFPNQFRNITWGASYLSPTGAIQAPAVGGNPQNQGEKIHELVNKYGHNVTTSGNFN